MSKEFISSFHVACDYLIKGKKLEGMRKDERK